MEWIPVTPELQATFTDGSCWLISGLTPQGVRWKALGIFATAENYFFDEETGYDFYSPDFVMGPITDPAEQGVGAADGPGIARP